MSLRVVSGLLAGLAWMLAGPASAQSSVVSRPSTPFLIHGAEVDSTERTATERQSLLVHPVSSVRAARLDAEAAAEGAGWFKDKSFPAGTLMFGAYAGERWSYCAVAETRQRWWNTDQFICYIDTDNDGRFDLAMDSGAPFNGVALLVFNTGLTHDLPTPVPYSRIDVKDGPVLEYVIGFDVERPRRSGRDRENNRHAPPLPASHISPTVGFRLANGTVVPLSGGGPATRVPLVDGQRATLRVKGAVIEIDGVNADNSVRYRVIEAIPQHVDQITMTLTTTTTWVVY